MELTQRLECTQELYGHRHETVCPGEIGFLGICGQTYPVKRGPNKIGRDPETCNIVLKLESISRQHAVINILNNNEYMLMDLGSANKTQLENKILQPYIPYPLRNGDTVQFGKIFGIFRLLEDDNDLPMTQAIDIPETPIPTRHVSKLNNIHGTTIPESPDVSDRDESFIASTQSKVNDLFKSPNNNFIKSSGKIISIQPIGMKKIDNVYWSSTKKSDSFTSNGSCSMHDGSCTTVKSNEDMVNNKTIFEMETQVQNCQLHNESTESIFNANTQIPEISESPTIHSMATQKPAVNTSVSNKHNKDNENGESIYIANTQIRENTLSHMEPIYGMETQLPSTKSLSPNNRKNNESSDSIYSANTQVPDSLPLSSIHSMDTQMPLSKNLRRVSNIHQQAPHNSGCDDSTDSIYNANTQLPENLPSPTVYGKETQTSNAENLPAVCKIQDQQNVQFDLIADNKENVNSIFVTKTQCLVNINLLQKNGKDNYENRDKILKKSEVTPNNSADIILFDEIDSQPLADECESQALLPSELGFLVQDNIINIDELKQTSKNKKCATRRNRLKSDSSTDCEDIDLMMSQRISDKAVDEDLTDCEDQPEFSLKPEKAVLKVPDDNDVTDCEDEEDENKKFNNSKESTKLVPGMNFEDLATQIVPGDLALKVDSNENEKETNFEDMLTQIVVEDNVSHDNSTVKTTIEDYSSQIIGEEGNVQKEIGIIQNLTPFKIPHQSSLKSKKRDIIKHNKYKPGLINSNKLSLSNEDDANYYAATQEIFNDLCSQKEASPKPIFQNKISSLNQEISIKDNKTTVQNKNTLKKKSMDNDVDEKVNDFVSSLSSEQIREVIGVEKGVTKLRKINNDSSSDIEITPKKKHPFRFMETDLPNSQEIKNSVSVTSNNITTESSSESETEQDSELCTPILFRNKKKKSNPVKIDLTKKFDIETLPSRVITRVRKPTSKAKDNHGTSKNILKPKFLTELEENIDKEIITENISRLKNKTNRSKTVTKNSKTHANKDDKISKNKSKTNIEKEKKERSSSKRSEDKPNKDKIDNNLNISKTSSRVNDESTDSNRRSSRTTRSGTKSNRDSNSKNNSPENISALDHTVKSNRTRKKDIEKSKVIPENETRRSARHKKSDTDHDRKTKTNETNQSMHEDSTVYSISSESGIDTPYKLKRPATFDTEMPFAKKFKTDVGVNNTSSRSTPMRKVKKQYVLFTAFPCDEVRIKLENLGAVIVTNVMECTVVLTLQIKRTFKLLCAVGLGKPIVGPSWVQACVDNKMVVDPWLYLMKDETTEKRFQFKLEKTLLGRRNFLRGYKVSCTPNVMPNAQELELIVKCSGGTWKTGGRHWLCVSCSADKQLWPQLQTSGALVVSTELILGGVLRQKLEIDRNRLA